MTRFLIILPILFVLTGCRPATNEAELVSEAQSFMASYAQDLIRHDGAAIGNRYKRSGTYFRGSFQEFDSTRVFYEQRWSGPTSFVFRNMKYEVLGPESVLITGQGVWGRGDSLEALVLDYAGVLVREESELRLQVEDETVISQ